MGVQSAIQLAYAFQKRLWRLFRPRTRGVKVMLFNPGGEILLVRNSYGRTHQFVFPGGGIRPWETPERAAIREVREELGCAVSGLLPVSTHFTSAEGKRDTVHLFEGRIGADPKPDGFEIAEARFFPLDALPDAISPATARRLAERQSKANADGAW